MAEEKAETKKPEWIKMKPAEVEALILDLEKQGNTPAKIGLILRDKHGIPKTSLLGKKIGKILKENNIDLTKYEKERVTAKIKNLEAHIAQRKHDISAKRALTKQLWVANKLR